MLESGVNNWASSSGGFSPWIQYDYSDFASESTSILHAGDGHSHVPSVEANESSGGSQVGNATRADDGIELRMLEIDWVSNVIVPGNMALLIDIHRIFGTLYSRLKSTMAT